MAKKVLTGGDGTTGQTGLQFLTDINDNFTELYTGKEINQATEATIVDADELGFFQAIGAALKKITFVNFYTALKAKFDLVYQAAGSYLTTTTHTAITTTPHVTAAEKITWSEKQNSLGYTPLNIDQSTSQTITGGQPVQNTLTASELVSTDANKKLQSLAVATYPSLTELSYVKGVSSAIQTQLGTKISKATGATYTLNSVSCLTAAEYAAITPDANTLYFIV